MDVCLNPEVETYLSSSTPAARQPWVVELAGEVSKEFFFYGLGARFHVSFPFINSRLIVWSAVRQTT